MVQTVWAMAKIEFSIPELYKMTFGYIGVPFPSGDLSASQFLPDVGGIAKSIIGKNDMYGKPYFMPIRINGIWLPNSPSMSLSVQKKIISTQVAGGDGTVKELISTDDFKLQVRGFAINFEANDYPYEDVEEIKNLFEVNKSLEITSDLCNIFGINNVVIESLKLPELVGIQNVQPFEIGMLSDDDFDVIIE